MDRLIPEERRIADINEWIRVNGLRQESTTTVDQEEERTRFREFAAYEAALHEKFFHDCDHEAKHKEQERTRRIQAWENTTIAIFASDETIRGVRLQPLAASCDTVFALASTWEWFSSSSVVSTTSDDMFVSLERFPSVSIRDFLALVNRNTVIRHVPPESVVDCCQIAHYLQNEKILQETVTILLESVDTANCMSICQLADQLHLPQLFERSLSHMMQSLQDIEDKDAWDYLSPELRERIQLIKVALQSSVHSCQSRLYFASLDEYLFIFAERVQYYRERLAEAKEQLAHIEYGTRAWMDTSDKIQRQEYRVRTLEAVLADQKRIFAGGHMLRD